MSTATEETKTARAEMIEKYVLLNALDLVLNNLINGSAVSRVGVLRGLIPDDSAEGVIPQADSLFGELWPTFEGCPDLDDVPEFLLADARSDLLVSRIFSRLAANPEKCQRIADHFARIAEDELVKLDGLTIDTETFDPMHGPRPTRSFQPSASGGGA